MLQSCQNFPPPKTKFLWNQHDFKKCFDFNRTVFSEGKWFCQSFSDQLYLAPAFLSSLWDLDTSYVDLKVTKVSITRRKGNNAFCLLDPGPALEFDHYLRGIKLRPQTCNRIHLGGVDPALIQSPLKSVSRELHGTVSAHVVSVIGLGLCSFVPM